MGRQTNFWMSSDDEKEFLLFLRRTGDVRILAYTSTSAAPRELNVLPSRDQPFWGAQYLWNCDLSEVPLSHFVKQQSYFVPDATQSEIIEFSRSFFDENRLIRGRIWAEMIGWRPDDASVTFKKSIEFVRWYNQLANWIKKQSTRRYLGDYVLPGAAKFADEGGQLCQAIGRNGRAI